VKKVFNGQTTVYVGAHFKKNVTTGEVTKSYTLGDRRVAMRRGSTITYLHGDHLGSASLTTDIYGGVNDEMRYYPYGDARSGTMATDRRFTGQREETAIGLYDYKARYYDPVIGRFIQADTIVPEPGNPQALNRYAYVYGNPLRYTDPTGYYSEDQIMQSFGVETWDQVLAHFQEGGTLAGLWGWLEVLRKAQNGDFVSYEMKPKFAPPGPATVWAWGNPYNGGYFKRNSKGQILVDGVHHGNFATSSGDIYSLWRQDAREPSVWEAELTTWSHHQHLHTRFCPDQFDWIDAGFDIVGIASDIVPILEPLGLGADTISIGRSIYNWTGDPNGFDNRLDLMVELLPKAAGSIPGVGVGFDMQSLILNLSRAVESTP
jgi:RHS repeat-associated protein